jgi:endonuclease/exonuclease/phosphatase family metal-dependent hydrolase
MTFPSRFPALRIDHVFVSPSIEVTWADTIRTPLARLASDHLPLVVEMNVPAAPARIEREDTVRQRSLNPQAV